MHNEEKIQDSVAPQRSPLFPLLFLSCQCRDFPQYLVSSIWFQYLISRELRRTKAIDRTELQSSGETARGFGGYAGGAPAKDTLNLRTRLLMEG